MTLTDLTVCCSLLPVQFNYPLLHSRCDISRPSFLFNFISCKGSRQSSQVTVAEFIWVLAVPESRSWAGQNDPVQHLAINGTKAQGKDLNLPESEIGIPEHMNWSLEENFYVGLAAGQLGNKVGDSIRGLKESPEHFRDTDKFLTCFWYWCLVFPWFCCVKSRVIFCTSGWGRHFPILHRSCHFILLYTSGGKRFQVRLIN